MQDPFEQYDVLLVSLSLFHTVDLTTAQNAFVELYGSLPHCCPNASFFKYTDPLYLLDLYWVNQAYKKVENAEIRDYRLGRIDTVQFFKFIRDKLDAEKLKKIANGKSGDPAPYHMCAKERENAVIERAWTATIGELKKEKVEKLIDLLARGKTIYLFSNTNPMDINKIIYLLKQYAGDRIKWSSTINIDTAPSNKPIQIVDNLFIYPSYRFNAFRNTKDNQAANITQPTLIQNLITDLEAGHKKDKIALVSQFSYDRDDAMNLQISAHDDKHFSASVRTLSHAPAPATAARPF